MPGPTNPHIRYALRLAAIYVLFGILWIFFSDRLLLSLAWDQQSLSAMQTSKGWLYVVITGGLVFLLVLRAEYRFRNTEERFRNLTETSNDWIWEVDTNGVYTYVSPKVESLLGYRPEEVVGRTPFDFMPPEEAARIGKQFASLVANREPIINLVNSNLDRQGRLVILESSGVPFFDQHGTWQGYRGIDRDITVRKKLEDWLRQSAMVFENIREGAVITDPDGKILDVNPAFCRITGYEKNEVIGQNPRLLKSDRHDRAFYQSLWHELLTSGHWRGEIWNRRKNGEVYPEWLSISGVCDALEQTCYYVGVFTDLSRLKQSESKLDHLAHYDPLTELPNRLLLNSRLAHALEWARRHRTKIAVHCIDLDQFKVVNDSLGHQLGDELLVLVSQRFRSRLRPDDTLARPGGDEFILIQEALADPQEAAAVAQDLLASLALPFRLEGGHEIYLGASIGISFHPGDGDNFADLLKNAEAAMYHAKENGRSRFFFYTEKMNIDALTRVRLEAALRQAVENREFILYYQPKYKLSKPYPLTGAEALIRWRNREGELIPPDRFIPLAEKTGLIGVIGDWVIDEACRQLRIWQDQGRPEIQVAVNVSARQFRAGNLAEVVALALKKHGIPARSLELELTESTLMEKPEEAVALLRQCAALGVGVALDDFGTGYSSFAYLSRLPISSLKIDQTFVGDLDHRPEAALIADSIILLAHRMGLKVVAEGVENRQQLSFLEAKSCDQVQGYLFSRPLPAAEFVKLPARGLDQLKLQP